MGRPTFSRVKKKGKKKENKTKLTEISKKLKIEVFHFNFFYDILQPSKATVEGDGRWGRSGPLVECMPRCGDWGKGEDKETGVSELPVITKVNSWQP